MRNRKRAAEALFFFGCLILLLGLICTAVPMIDNAQVRRILASLELKESSAAVNALNGFWLLCLHENYVVLMLGIALTALSVVLMKRDAEQAPPPSPSRTPVRRTSAATEQRFRAPAPSAPAEPFAPAAPSAPVEPFAPRGVPADPMEKYKPHPILGGETIDLSAWERPTVNPFAARSAEVAAQLTASSFERPKEAEALFERPHNEDLPQRMPVQSGAPSEASAPMPQTMPLPEEAFRKPQTHPTEAPVPCKEEQPAASAAPAFHPPITFHLETPSKSMKALVEQQKTSSTSVVKPAAKHVNPSTAKANGKPKIVSTMRHADQPKAGKGMQQLSHVASSKEEASAMKAPPSL